jgi:hypothetical protein
MFLRYTPDDAHTAYRGSVRGLSVVESKIQVIHDDPARDLCREFGDREEVS